MSAVIFPRESVKRRAPGPAPFVIVERTSKLLFLRVQTRGEMREMEAIYGGPIIARKQERLVFAAGKLDRFACRGIPCASLRVEKNGAEKTHI